MIALPFTLLFYYGVLGLIFGTVSLFGSKGFIVIHPAAWEVALGIGAAGLLALGARQRNAAISGALNRGALVALIIVLLSDIPARHFGFYLGSGTIADVVLLGLTLTLILGSWDEPKRFAAIFSPVALLATQALMASAFLSFADGRLIFSDDHPTFVYRLQLLRDHFPQIPFYSTDWNLGYQAREFYATGVLNVFALVAPFLYSIADFHTLEGASVYTYFIPYLYMFIMPWSVYLAARLLGLRMGAGAAGLLALGPSATFFEWLLKYGTIGFTLSAGLFALSLALALRLGVDKEEPRLGHGLALAAVASLCLTWTLTAWALLPVLFAAALRPKHLLQRKRARAIALFALLFIGLNASWWVTFVRESRVLDFLSGSSLPGTSHAIYPGEHLDQISADRAKEAAASPPDRNFTEMTKHGFSRLRDGLAKVNPLILLLSFPGLVCLPVRRHRFVLTATIVWLIVGAWWGDQFKPQLEMRRMVIHASFLMCILAAAAIERWIAAEAPLGKLKRFSSRSALVLLMGAVVLSPLTTSAMYLNRSLEKFQFAPEMLGPFIEAIREHGGDGTVFFAGFILHDLGASNPLAQNGGHVAPLATFTDKHLYASDFQHRKWSSVDPIPESYRRRGPEGVEEFLDMINATSVVTFHTPWTRYCRAQGYREAFSAGNFRLFIRQGPQSGYFLRGAGRLLPTRSGLELVAHTEEIVLRFRHLRGLEVSPSSVELFAEPMFHEELGGGKTAEVNFVGLRVPTSVVSSGEPIRIGYRVGED